MLWLFKLFHLLIFQNLPRLADKARTLVEACDCGYGCPRCLTQHGCPQRNEGLNRGLGLFLLKAIGESGFPDG
ncbi:MAG: DUF1998 domain-containing protein [Microcystis aeruginosa LL13-06]|nr:DUF1998 domain-containing protein [Microcystis aeruginosa LL13-06]